MRGFIHALFTVVLGDILWIVTAGTGIAMVFSGEMPNAVGVAAVAGCPAVGALLAGVVAGLVTAMARQSPRRAALTRLFTPGAAMSLGVACVPAVVALEEPSRIGLGPAVALFAWCLGVVILGAATAAAVAAAARYQPDPDDSGAWRTR